MPRFKRTAPADIAVLPTVLPLVRRWKDNKRRMSSSRFRATAYLFHGAEGGRVSRNDWKDILARNNLRAGWKSGHGKRFTLRSLRPTFGSWMLNARRGDLGKTQRQLRHRSPETTARYYARYQVRQLQEVVSSLKM